MEFPLFLLAVAVLVPWLYWYKSIFRTHTLRPTSKIPRILLGVVPLVCITFLALTLLEHASHDVRLNGVWILFYTLGGAVWLRFALFVFSFLGISPRDDVLERNNGAASWVIVGALVAITLCYAGANVGNGPGPQVVFFCAFLSTVSWFLFWFCLERVFRLVDRITIERDKGLGLRSGAWIAGLGLLLGTSVTGDWHSFGKTLRDFLHLLWLPLIFFFVATAVEALFKSEAVTEKRGSVPSAVVAAGYLIAAIAWVAWRGLH
jgi:hypothetical protein